MSTQCNNSTQSKNDGRGSELKYEIYFPPNSCMPKDEKIITCRKVPLPLQNAPSCQSIYSANCVNENTGNKSIYGLNPQPSELYGGALAMNEGDGLFYYHNPFGFDLSLTYNNHQPYHFA
jgi:hypothetical protein